MSALPELTARFNDIAQVLQTLREMEKALKSNHRNHLQKSRLVSASRASTYVMIYNAIEAAMREVFTSLRDAIEQESLTFHSVSEYWRLDLFQSKFLRKMQDGFSHGTLLADMIPITTSIVQWEEEEKGRLPFSGNFGQSHALRVRDLLGLQWAAPNGTLGGSDLENVRKRRNALAHGLETFEQAGATVTAKELLDVLGRIRTFMVSYIEAIETYQNDKGYLDIIPLPQGLVEDLGEIQDPS